MFSHEDDWCASACCDRTVSTAQDLNLHYGGGALSFHSTWGQIFNSKSPRTQRRKSTKRVSFRSLLTAGSCSQPNKSTASGTRQPQRGRLLSVFRVAQGQMCNKNIICHRYFLQKFSVCWALSWIPHLRPPWGPFVSSLNPNNRLFFEAQSLLRHTWRTLFYSGPPPLPLSNHFSWHGCCNMSCRADKKDL